MNSPFDKNTTNLRERKSVYTDDPSLHLKEELKKNHQLLENIQDKTEIT